MAFSLLLQAAEKLIKRGSMREKHPSGAKAPTFLKALLAQLKPCPCYKTRSTQIGQALPVGL
jgi:hypothetical protein